MSALVFRLLTCCFILFACLTPNRNCNSRSKKSRISRVVSTCCLLSFEISLYLKQAPFPPVFPPLSANTQRPPIRRSANHMPRSQCITLTDSVFNMLDSQPISSLSQSVARTRLCYRLPVSRMQIPRLSMCLCRPCLLENQPTSNRRHLLQPTRRRESRETPCEIVYGTWASVVAGEEHKVAFSLVFFQLLSFLFTLSETEVLVIL